MNLPKDITEHKENLRNKNYTLVELVEKYIQNIDTTNEDLNAMITVTKDEAYQRAKELDKQISDTPSILEDLPLFGVVTSLKDIFLTKGVRTTAASKVLENYVPAYSATVVKRLEEAGAIIIGKTNLDAWAHGSSGENSDFGPTKNPHNKDYVPGGSSSGSAVSVAADYSLVSTATDTCGSTRLPANFTGLVGLKPTYGSVSRYGVIAMASSLDSMGHITKTVEDSKKVYNVTKGFDAKDSTVAKNIKYLERKEKYTVGIPKEFFESGGLSVEVESDLQKVINKYKDLGVEFKEISLPHTKYGISVYYIIQPAEVSSNLGRYDGIRYGESRDTFGDEAKRRIMLGTYVLSAGYQDAYYKKAMKVRSIIIKEVEKAYTEVDALIAPVAPTPAFKLGEKTNNPLQMYLTDIFAATANLTGIPAIAIPSGQKTNDNIPLGFQLMGPRFGEEILFGLGELFQKD